MDKNKKQADMLAAGRKKLQQYRKKKDTKGSSSKTENKKEADLPTSKAKDKNQSKQASTAKLDSVDFSTTNSVENSVPVDHSVSEVDSSVPSETLLSRDGESGNVDVEIAQGRLQESSAIAVDVGGGLTSDADLAQEFEKKYQEAEGSGSTQYDGGTGEKGHDTLQDSDSIQVGVVRSEENISGESLAGVSHERETIGESKRDHTDGSSLQSHATHREEGILDMTASAETTIETGRTQGINLTDMPDLLPGTAGSDLSCLENSEFTDVLEHDPVHGSKADIELEGAVGLPQEDVIVVSKSLDKSLKAETEVLSGRRTTCYLSDAGSVDLYQLAEVLRQLKEEDYRLLFSLGPSTFKAELKDALLTQDGFADSMEQLKEQLYVSNVAKDFLSLQLAEQNDLQMEFDAQNDQLQNEVSNLRCLLSESVESRKTLSEELGQCRTELHAVSAGKEDLETQFLIAKSEVEEISFRSTELQSKLERSNEELTNVSVELAQCKDLLEALQTENSTLNGNLISVADERMMLEEGKEYLVHENEKLSTQLIEHQERFAAECAKHVQLEIDLKEAMLHIEQLTEENIVLSSNLDIRRAKVEEIESDNVRTSSHARDVTDPQESTHVPTLVPSGAVSDACSHQSTERCEEEVTFGLAGDSTTLKVTDEPALQHIETEDVDNSADLDALNIQFEGAKMIMQKLEKAIEGMQSRSVSLSRSSSKVPAPGVSKLIQAFEKSKAQHDDIEAESLQVAEDEQPAFKSAKEQTRLLRALLAELDQNSKKANELFREEQKGRKTANLALSELKDLYGASKRYSDHMEAKNNKLVNKLAEYESRIEELLTHLYGIEQNADTMRDSILNQLEIMQKEVADKADALEKEWNSTVATVSDMVDKLDACTGSQLTSTGLAGSSLNVVSRVVASVNTATEVIADLHKKLEAAYKDHEETHRSYEDLHQKLEASYKDHEATRSSSEDLDKKLEAAYMDNEAIRCSYEDLNEKFSDMNSKKELATGILQTIYDDLRELVISSLEDGIGNAADLEDKTPHDHLQHNNCKKLTERLGKLLEDRILLQSANKELVSAKDELESEKIKLESIKDELESTKYALEVELVNTKHDIEELAKKNIDINPILKLVEDVEALLQMQDTEKDSEVSPVSRLESLVAFLIQNYTNASQQVSLLREELDKVTELSELQGKLHQLSSLDSDHADETQTLKEKIKKMDEDLEAARVELQSKGAELEQSENRVNSIREKLSIAVAKGKGLIVQRDSLKQSLSEMSTELERCSMELQLKESRLYDVQTKLKSYSEAGERVEALESELSYIRNSATALRESFLVKDSALQRIEEILEDIDLPEHFHPRDIVEKIEWLARSVAGNSLPATDWDQKSSGGGGSYSDAGFVVMENWKEDVQPTSNSGLDELRRNYEELQSKFYGLAEQNEMLEQSLMERNNLVQRWEEVLDRIDMPLQLRSVEPEDRIEWLGQALSEAHHDRDSLHQKIDNYEAYCDSLTSTLDESKRKVSDHEESLQGLAREKELLAEKLESLTLELGRVSEKAIQFALEKDRLLTEITDLREKLVDNVENKDGPHTEDYMNRFQVLISEALQEGSPEPEGADSCTKTDRLEGSLRKLIDNYMALSPRKHVLQDTDRDSGPEDTFGERSFEDVLNSKEKDTMLLKEQLEEALVNLADVKEGKDKILEKYQSLIVEFESLGKRNDDLQVRFNQEEQKVGAAREKLNVAVRKGKALVQQRDSLKQNIDVLNTEVERLKSELNQREDGLVSYEQNIRDLSVYPEKVEALERESLFLKNRLAETEQNLLDSRQTLTRLCDVVNSVDIGDGSNISDPVHKLERIGKVCCELQAAVTSSENESKKSRRAAELLAAELNEVQERADNLQEDLAQAEAAFLDLANERDLVNNARVEALSCLGKFTTARTEERKKELMEIMKLKTGIDQLKKGCFGFTDLLVNFFAMDSELLRRVGTGFQAFLQQDGTKVEHQLPFTAPCCVLPKHSVNEVKFPATGSLEELSDDSRVIEVFGIVGHGLQDCIREIDDLSERLYKHSMSSDQQAKGLFKVMESVYRDIGLQKDSFELMRSNISNLESVSKEKDTVIILMRENFKLLYEACNNSILEIEKCNSHIGGNGLPSGVRVLGKMGVDLNLPISIDGRESVDKNAPFTEERIRTMADTLLFAVKELTSFELGTVENSQKELKTTISNLQNALQEKDVQGNQICTELVNQIKEAEAIANNYLIDLESSKTQVHNLEKQVEKLQREQIALESRLKELQDVETSSKELHDRINSLNGDITKKEQENEALMQALDEEESQMEELTNRNEELEKLLQQKNLALEHLEASRGKTMAKLSTTVSKFEELRQLSESLVSEVENLQSQVQSRDEEISFLRQEVTRCTSDVLATSHESSTTNSNEMHELFTWLNLLVSRLGVDLKFDVMEWNGQIQACKEVFEKEIASVVSEVEDLRVMAQSKEALLQVERTKVEELQHRREALESSLHEKELQLASLQGARGPGETPNVTSSEIVEVEPTINKRGVAGALVPSHVRSLRKGNSDQVAIAIDMDQEAGALIDDDDDKVHGFKSLSTSRIVPRFTRPVSDMVDGLWVSCDRALDSLTNVPLVGTIQMVSSVQLGGS
ncbi:hypothetical protein MKW98_007763 [Papaver atlanticum]|uniref:Uncharacterized protein n=1 Tax=Papaver atlanticum TaxID=357466 RepID=A0AAD4RXP7_9MAGN|nr:hypothetical protein MKW98_007763 [Papaver atlanticum]